MPRTSATSAKMQPTPWQRIVRSRIKGAAKAQLLASGRTTSGSRPVAGSVRAPHIERRGGRV